MPSDTGNITVDVLENNLSGLVDEMMERLFKTGYSTIVRESRDGSCGLLDAKMRVVTSPACMPIHFGAFSHAGKVLLQHYSAEEMQDGDAFLLNHPYQGQITHATDTTIIRPVFYRGELVAFTANMEHKPDLGGLVPGTNSARATEIFHEGLLLPPVRYYERGAENTEVRKIIEANSRTPELVVGDLRGQVGTCRVGSDRLIQLYERYGRTTIFECFDTLIDRMERRIRAAISLWRDGVEEATGTMDDDGIEIGQNRRVHVKVNKKHNNIEFDFRKSGPQAIGPINATSEMIRNCCYFGVISLVAPNIRFNEGVTRAIATRFSRGTIVNPIYPAPVNAYTSVTVLAADVVLTALGRLVPSKAVAASGTAGPHAISGLTTRTGRTYVLYELSLGGQGATAAFDGASGVHSAVNAGTASTPLEIIESEFPIRMTQWELRPDSGGTGKFRGGLGNIREYTFLSAGRYTSRRRMHDNPPWGLQGGGESASSELSLDGLSQHAKVSNLLVPKGSRIRELQPGGGGFGNPFERDPLMVLDDYLDQHMTIGHAREKYGVVIDETKGVVDWTETNKLRKTREVKDVRSHRKA